jgi:nucleotide-binding universal stress UspA family protein
MKILVAYDGTLQSKDALVYGLKKAREKNGEVIALHVFDRGLFVGYDSHPAAEELVRLETTRLLEDARKLIAEHGQEVKADIVTEEGNPAEEVISFARERNIDVLLCPPRFRRIIRKFVRTGHGAGGHAVDGLDGTTVATVTV